MSSQPPKYTSDQLECYLQRIWYPKDIGTTRLEHFEDFVKEDPLGTLAKLQLCHLTSIPWGNSGLHYSPHRSISIAPHSVFEKLVVRRLDGYCMENTTLFYVVLQSLGFQVYAAGARVSRAAATGVNDGQYLAMGHMVLIVTIMNKKYMVDVGFGNNCAISPIPLEENATAHFIAPGEMRLIRGSLPEFKDKSQKVWIYQTRYTPDSDWIPNFSFSEVELLPQDFAVLNFYQSQNRASWFTQSFVCTRMILNEPEKVIEGQHVIAGRELKRRIHGQTEVLQTFNSEEDRIEALATWFGMHFQEDEVQGIRGLSSQIR